MMAIVETMTVAPPVASEKLSSRALACVETAFSLQPRHATMAIASMETDAQMPAHSSSTSSERLCAAMVSLNLPKRAMTATSCLVMDVRSVAHSRRKKDAPVMSSVEEENAGMGNALLRNIAREAVNVHPEHSA